MTTFFNQIISSANAQEIAAEAAAKESSPIVSFIPLILIFTVFYFLIIRPQTKKMKDHQALINNIKIGDKVITNGGIIGIVKEINNAENIIDIEIANQTIIKVLRPYIADLVNKDIKK